jgi:restriction system protein
MKRYLRVRLGRKGVYAAECFAGNFIGTYDLDDRDLTNELAEDWREFNRKFIPVFLAEHPEKSKISAGLACGSIWTVSKGIRNGDIVICPDGTGRYRVGELDGDYYYVAGGILPHRRPVRWMNTSIDRSDMSDALRRSAASMGTVSDISRYRDEIELLLSGGPAPTLIPTDEAVEDPAAFALEKHLEDFLVRNWAQTELGREFDIFDEDGDQVGQQYPTDTGAIDILAISKDKRKLLVVELKKGRASDAVVGQVLRYMGFVKDELAEAGQSVTGVIIALEDDQRIRRALAMAPSIAFYRYQVSFKLLKA